ncbi:MAG TPA: hypothetical protein PK156_06425 [Polyangium sp.]|nr:hypothetical protein [Polyangium sp.]
MTFSNLVGRSFVVMAACAALTGCGSEATEPEYGFDETDMQNAVVGNWSGDMSLTGQMSTTFTLSIKQVPALQPACGSRTFNAPLCVETSSMSLEGTLTTADKVFDAAVMQGSFFVIGLEMNNGELSFSGSGVNINGGLDMMKTDQELTISGSKSGTATMHR